MLGPESLYDDVFSGRCEQPPEPLCSRDNHVMKYKSGGSRSNAENQASYLSLAKTRGVPELHPLTMLQAPAQAVDFKVGRHFGEGQAHTVNDNQTLELARLSELRHLCTEEEAFYNAWRPR